ncbi:MAG: hypothetical protein R3F41_17470 [Gammaproteobacteria bacterium]|nr:hypothetical protein [Pseudomonadales bacterium]
MSSYFVGHNALFNGDHAVHAENCQHLPAEQYRTYLGEFTNCRPAVQQAMTVYPTANGCFSCCESCHRVFSISA